MPRVCKKPREYTPSDDTSSEPSPEKPDDPEWNMNTKGRQRRRWKRVGKRSTFNSQPVTARSLSPISSEASSSDQGIRSEDYRVVRGTKLGDSVFDGTFVGLEGVEAVGIGQESDREVRLKQCRQLVDGEGNNGGIYGAAALSAGNQLQQPFPSNQDGSSSEGVLTYEDVGGIKAMMRAFLPKKRKYVFKKRQPVIIDKSISALRARWLASSKRLDNPFLARQGCCRMECFRHVDAEYAIRQ